MRGLYQRNGIYWARLKVRGHEYRASLRTRSLGLAERRLKGQRLGIKPRTGARYAQSLACCRQWLDGKQVHEIDGELLKQIIRARGKQGITNATLRRDLTAISSVLGHCCDEGWIEENPAHMLDRSRFKEKRLPIVLPRADSIAQVFAEQSRFMDMAELSLETGMRQEEVAGLEHDRIDRKRMAESGTCRRRVSALPLP
jgi:integrase/recombinase XerD